jgi:hypothetical protein
MHGMDQDRPGLRTRLLFWYILGCLSTLFAEVISGSDIFPFYTLVSYLLVIPLYTLHTVALWYVVWTKGRPWLYALFPAGCLFGLYEAYVTKVLWSPTWSTGGFTFLGVYVVESIVLVPFWHTFISFIIPLLVAESTLTSSGEIYSLLPGWARKTVRRAVSPIQYVLPVLGGLFQSTGAATVNDAMLSGVSASLYVAALIYVWRRLGGTVYTMRSLLPEPRSFRVIAALLVVYYMVTGALLRPEELPGLVPQAAIWVLYAFFGALLVMGLRKSKEVEASPEIVSLNPSIGRVLLLGALLSLGSVAGITTGLALIWIMVIWVAGSVFGLTMIALTVINVTRS